MVPNLVYRAFIIMAWPDRIHPFKVNKTVELPMVLYLFSHLTFTFYNSIGTKLFTTRSNYVELRNKPFVRNFGEKRGGEG